jgi:hypothetical protein
MLYYYAVVSKIPARYMCIQVEGAVDLSTDLGFSDSMRGTSWQIFQSTVASSIFIFILPSQEVRRFSFSSRISIFIRLLKLPYKENNDRHKRFPWQ